MTKDNQQFLTWYKKQNEEEEVLNRTIEEQERLRKIQEQEEYIQHEQALKQKAEEEKKDKIYKLNKFLTEINLDNDFAQMANIYGARAQKIYGNEPFHGTSVSLVAIRRQKKGRENVLKMANDAYREYKNEEKIYLEAFKIISSLDWTFSDKNFSKRDLLQLYINIIFCDFRKKIGMNEYEEFNIYSHNLKYPYFGYNKEQVKNDIWINVKEGLKRIKGI